MLNKNLYLHKNVLDMNQGTTWAWIMEEMGWKKFMKPRFFIKEFFFFITNQKLYSCIIDTVESDFLVSEFSNFENVYLGAIKNVFENTLA